MGCREQILRFNILMVRNLEGVGSQYVHVTYCIQCAEQYSICHPFCLSEVYQGENSTSQLCSIVWLFTRPGKGLAE